MIKNNVIRFGSHLKVDPAAGAKSYNTGWDWLMHPPRSSDGKDDIGDCYGRAWGPLKNGKRHGVTYLAHFSFYKGQCWHQRMQDTLVWTDGETVYDNNWVCFATYIDGKLVPAETKQYRIHLNVLNPDAIKPGTVVAFCTSRRDPDFSVLAQWYAGGAGIPAIIDVKQK